MIKAWFKVWLGAGALAIGSVAQAGIAYGGAVGYGPEAAAVPTLSEWMLMGMGLLLVAVAYRVLRTRVSGRLWSTLTLVGGAAMVAASGHSLVGEVRAAAPTDVAMSQPGGGTVEVYQDLTIKVTNTTAQRQIVRSITPYEGFTSVEPEGSPRCTVGMVVQPSAYCYVLFAPIDEEPPPPV